MTYKSLEMLDDKGEIKYISRNRFPSVKLYKTYYINLDYRIDRREYMDDLLKNLNIEYERFSGFKPEIIKFKKKETYENWFYQKDKVKSKLNMRFTKKEFLGIIGCLGSYIKLLEKIQLEKPPINQYIIILEDDAFLSQKSLAKIDDVMNDSDIDIDILRINPTFFQNATKLKAVERIKKYLFKITKNTFYCGGTHINVIPTNKIDKILNYLKKSLVMPIDSLFSFNYLESYFLFIFNEKSFNEELRLINDIPKEKKPINKQILNYCYNKLC